jgi:hypothetical protein
MGFPSGRFWVTTPARSTSFVPNRIPPPWIESRSSRRKLYLLHLERLYTAGLKGCESYGAASKGRRLSPDEVKKIIPEPPKKPQPVNRDLRRVCGAPPPPQHDAMAYWLGEIERAVKDIANSEKS